MKKKYNKPERKNVWDKKEDEIGSSDWVHFFDRVVCSRCVSQTALEVLWRLLRHRDPERGGEHLCCPSIAMLAMRLYHDMDPKSAYNKVREALKELREAGIIVVEKRRGISNFYNVYHFRWSWGTGMSGEPKVIAELGQVREGEKDAFIAASKTGKGKPRGRPRKHPVKITGAETDMPSVILTESPPLNKREVPCYNNGKSPVKITPL